MAILFYFLFFCCPLEEYVIHWVTELMGHLSLLN